MATGPDRHEIGDRTYLVAPVDEVDEDGVWTVTIGTATWFVLFVALLPFYGHLAVTGEDWVIWTCLAGVGLGGLGLEVCRRRRRSGDFRHAR